MGLAFPSGVFIQGTDLQTDVEQAPEQSRWWWYLRLAAGLGLLAVVVWRVDLSEMSIRWDGVLVAGFAGATVAILATRGLSAARWGVIADLGPKSWGHLTHLYMVSGFFSLFLPTAIGGDVVRAVAVRRMGPPTGEAVAGVVLDRLFGVAALLVYLLLGLALAPAPIVQATRRIGLALPDWMLLAGAGVAVGLVAAVLIWPGRFGRLLKLGREGLGLARRALRTPRVLLGALALSLVIQALFIVSWLVLASGMRFGLGLSSFLVTVPIVSLAAMLPVTIAGLGVREGLWVLLLTPYGLVPANVLAYSLLYFLATTVVGAAGGVLFATRGLDGRSAPAVPGPSSGGTRS